VYMLHLYVIEHKGKCDEFIEICQF
jgi:hypothetical protein